MNEDKSIVTKFGIAKIYTAYNEKRYDSNNVYMGWHRELNGDECSILENKGKIYALFQSK